MALLGPIGTATCHYVHLLDEVLDATWPPSVRPRVLVPPAGDGARRGDRREPREDAAEDHVLLPEAPDRPGPQPAPMIPPGGQRRPRQEPRSLR